MLNPAWSPLPKSQFHIPSCSLIQGLVMRLYDNKIKYGEARVLIFCSVTNPAWLGQDTGEAAGAQGRERQQAVSARPVCTYTTLLWWGTTPLVVLRLVCPNHPVHLQILSSMYKSLLEEHKSYPNHD